MADVTPGNAGAQFGDFPAIHTHGGRFIQYNIFENLFEITSKYRSPIMPIGRGAYGIVCSVLNSETNEMVAVKKIANAFDNHMDAKRTLREIKLLRHLDHENVIGIRDVIPPPLRREFADVYIATELMDTDLHQIIRSNQSLSEEHCQLLGTPTESDLGFLRNEDARRYIRQLAAHPRQPLANVFPHVHPLAIDLIDRMLTFDPTRRITVEEALAHPYLERLHDIADEPVCPEPFSFDFEQQPLGEEQMKDMIYMEALALNPDYA
ncbi:hypothetical protein PTKIN_Ptkin03bG0024500 [Pterospermum kingtungense]